MSVGGESENEKKESIGESEKVNFFLFTFLATSSGPLPAKPSAVATRPPPAGAREEATFPPPLREVRFFREVEDILFLSPQSLSPKSWSLVSLARSLAPPTTSLSKEGNKSPRACARAV